MSQQLNSALEDMGKAMSTLRLAIRGIPVRREGFKGLHDQFARSVATLTTHMSYARVLLDEEAARRRTCRHLHYSALRAGSRFDVLCRDCQRNWDCPTPYPPRF